MDGLEELIEAWETGVSTPLKFNRPGAKVASRPVVLLPPTEKPLKIGEGVYLEKFSLSQEFQSRPGEVIGFAQHLCAGLH